MLNMMHILLSTQHWLASIYVKLLFLDGYPRDTDWDISILIVVVDSDVFACIDVCDSNLRVITEWSFETLSLSYLILFY